MSELSLSETQREPSQSRTAKWGWGILIAISALLILNGAGWQPIGWDPHPLRETPTALVTLPGAPGYLYAGLKNGDVWHTTDYGDTWEKMPFNLGGIWFSLLILPG